MVAYVDLKSGVGSYAIEKDTEGFKVFQKVKLSYDTPICPIPADPCRSNIHWCNGVSILDEKM